MFEINLVPDVKAKMVKAQRTRNVIGLFCALIVAAVVTTLLIVGGIKGGQDIAIGVKNDHIEQLSTTIGKFSNLNSYVTIQSQLNSLQTVADNRKLLSRLFSFIWVFEPTSEDGGVADKVEYSDVNIDMTTGTLKFEAQARAMTGARDNFVTLEAFEKSMPMMKYDYGNYVTATGKEIPSVCIVENNTDGSHLKDEKGRLYAKWAKSIKGCDPDNNMNEDGDIEVDVALIKEEDVISATGSDNYETIYRTPIFSEWYEKEFMDEGGNITDVAHFESQCITYTYFDSKWGSENKCDLVPGGIKVSNKTSASNGGNSVLKFTATLGLDPAVFLAKNEHMVAIGPRGYTNVTGSYTAISELFTEEAVKCDGVNCEIIDYGDDE